MSRSDLDELNRRASIARAALDQPEPEQEARAGARLPEAESAEPEQLELL
jgi:hypothetical protein